MHKEDGADMRTIIKKELPSSGASDGDIRKKKKKKKKEKEKLILLPESERVYLRMIMLAEW